MRLAVQVSFVSPSREKVCASPRCASSTGLPLIGGADMLALLRVGEGRKAEQRQEQNPADTHVDWSLMVSLVRTMRRHSRTAPYVLHSSTSSG